MRCRCEDAGSKDGKMLSMDVIDDVNDFLVVASLAEVRMEGRLSIVSKQR